MKHTTTTTTTDGTPFRARGSVVVVTGGASGIGKAFCESFAKRGASTVVVVDLNMEEAAKVALSLPEGVGVAMRANCGIEMDIRRVIMATQFQYGPIDAFVANAGIPSNGGPEVPNDEWERIWKVNVMQHVYVARHLFPSWICSKEERRDTNGKALLITASAAGLLTQIGSLPYSVTKHAAVGIAEWLQITYKASNIAVSCLCPQAVRTGMTGGQDGGDGAVAGNDGVLDPLDVANESIEAMEKGQFLVLPHKNVKTYFQRKASDYDRWLRGMQRVQRVFGDIMRRSPPMSAAKL